MDVVDQYKIQGKHTENPEETTTTEIAQNGTMIRELGVVEIFTSAKASLILVTKT